VKVTAEVLKAIQTSIQIEQEGLDFYTQAAQQARHPQNKRIFRSLAREESAHLQLFQDAHAALLDQGAWLSPEEVTAISPASQGRHLIFSPAHEVQEGQLEAVTEHELLALERGIEAEQASIDFYTQQRDQTDDPHARALYAYLIEQEEVHRRILQSEYDYLTGMGKSNV
jgi:rubrerythrin